MPTTTIFDYAALAIQSFVDHPPPDMFAKSGAFCKMLQKRGVFAMVRDYGGNVKIFVPGYLTSQGNAGANALRALNNAGGANPVRFEVPAADHYQYMRIQDDMLEFGENGQHADPLPLLDAEARQTATGSLSVLSSYLCSDGTGRLAKGDGAYLVSANPTVIKFVNRDSVFHFQEDDAITLIPAAAVFTPGEMPTPRTPDVAETFPLVAKRDEDQGTITLNGQLDTFFSGAVNTDYIGKAVSYDGKRNVSAGLFTWIPRTLSEVTANPTLWGLDRSRDPARLAGRRVQISGTDSLYTIIGKIGTALKRARGGALMPNDDYVIIIPTEKIVQLLEEFAQRNIVYTMVTSRSEASTMTMGVSMVVADIPDVGRLRFMTDHHFSDPLVTPENDHTYLALNIPDWYWNTGSSGYGWKNYGGVNGRGGHYLHNDPNEPDAWYAQHGAKGNLVCKNISQQVLASPTALS